MSDGSSAGGVHEPEWNSAFPVPVIVADDDPDICDELAAYLSRHGCSVSTVDNGRSLVQTLAGLDGQVIVLLDVAMPRSNICDTLASMAQMDVPPALILCSGQYGDILDNVACLARAKNLPVAGVLPKPLAPERLKVMLREAANLLKARPLELPAVSPVLGRQRVLTVTGVTEGELRQAIENREFRIVVQPLYSPRENACCSIEALARWEHPVRGYLAPKQFLPWVRHHGLLLEFTKHIIQGVVTWMHIWGTHEISPRIGVNVPPSLLADGRLAEFLIQETERQGVDPSKMILELTEDEILPEPEVVLDAMLRLRLSGFRIAIDDFGAEYASLNRLMWLPISAIKIDRSLIVAQASSQASIILENAVELAHKLNLMVIAEGIEDEASLEKMIELGCDLIQGYVIQRPMPAEDLVPWMLAQPASAKRGRAGSAVTL